MEINIETIIVILAAIAGAFGVNKLLISKLKKDITEAGEQLLKTSKKIKEFRDEKSDGGKKLTEEEMRELVPLLFDSVVETVDVIEIIIEKFKKS